MKSCYTEGKLQHVAGSARVNGFLEDYCFLIEAFIALYEVCFEASYLLKAEELMQEVLLHFYDKETGMFFFTSETDKALISRKMEISDNVLPASNSSLAQGLFRLGHHFEKEEYIRMSSRMLSAVLSEIEHYGAGYSNWAMLLGAFIIPVVEVAIVGKSVDEKRKKLRKHYLPNVIFAGSASESSLPLLKNRYVKDETFIYVCRNKACQSPVTETEEALKQIRQ